MICFGIPKIKDVLQKMVGFTYATSLDLNMGYYTIHLTSRASHFRMIITPWGKNKYNRLPLGTAGAPNVFQEKMSKIMAGLQDAGLCCNMKKCSFVTQEIEYHGYLSVPTGIWPLAKEVEAIQ